METRIFELQGIIEAANNDIGFFNSNKYVFDTLDDFVKFVVECDEDIAELSDELKQHQVVKFELLQNIQVLLAENQEALEQWYAAEDFANDELRTQLKEFFNIRLINVENLKRAYSSQNYKLVASAIYALNSVKELAIQKYEMQTYSMSEFYIRFINDETKEFGYTS